MKVVPEQNRHKRVISADKLPFARFEDRGARLQEMHTARNTMLRFRHACPISGTSGIIDAYPAILRVFGICDTDAERNIVAARPVGPAREVNRY